MLSRSSPSCKYVNITLPFIYLPSVLLKEVEPPHTPLALHTYIPGYNIMCVLGFSPRSSKHFGSTKHTFSKKYTLYLAASRNSSWR